MIHPLQALLLGAVEGLTEFLPVSSTGHLILAGRLLGLHGASVTTFEIVIQAGAVGAIVVLYRSRLASCWRGLQGHDPSGRRLLINLLVTCLPAAVAGLLLHRAITAYLFETWPVIAALAVGGIVMIGVGRRCDARPPSKTLDTLMPADALLIGCAQALSLWPGTSRAMVTILAGLLCGLSGRDAAAYSFLAAVPTLGAATLFEAYHGGGLLLRDVPASSLACGFGAAAVVAILAVRGFIKSLPRLGFAPFGWYRVGVAAAVWWAVAGR